ncbi:MAG TPA: YfiR family protein, partial [bacterium]|nr:YfiR family protein [bacterium]
FLSAQTPISKEYQIKAVFLFNFVQFVQWPADTFTAPDEPFCIGILGDDPFGDFMDKTIEGEKINGHPLIIRRYTAVEEVQDCQILFISSSETPKMAGILDTLKTRSILTVSDADDFIKNGGIIRFFTEDNKIHLRINLEAAKSVNLTISSEVLRLSNIVDLGKE